MSIPGSPATQVSAVVPRDTPQGQRLTNVVQEGLNHLEVPIVLALLLLAPLGEEHPRVLELDLELVHNWPAQPLRHLGEVDLEQLVRVRDAVLVARHGRGRVRRRRSCWCGVEQQVSIVRLTLISGRRRLTRDFRVDADSPVELALGAQDVHVRDPALLHHSQLAAVLLVRRDAQLASRPATGRVDDVERVALTDVRVPNRRERVRGRGRLLDARVQQVVKRLVLVL